MAAETLFTFLFLITVLVHVSSLCLKLAGWFTDMDVSHSPTQLLCEVTGPILLQLSWFQLVYSS